MPVKGSVPKARYRTSAVAYKNRMLVVGGHDGAKHLNDFYQFNFDSLEWSLVETTGQVPPPSPRDSHSAVICGDAMYLFGGSTGSARNDLCAHILLLNYCHYIMLFNRNKYYVILYYIIVSYYVMLYYIILYCVILYCII